MAEKKQIEVVTVDFDDTLKMKEDGNPNPFVIQKIIKLSKKVDKLYSTRDLTIEVNSFDEDDCPWEVDEDQRLMLSKSGKQMLGKFTYQKGGTGSKSKNLFDSFAGIFINTEDVVKNG